MHQKHTTTNTIFQIFWHFLLCPFTSYVLVTSWKQSTHYSRVKFTKVWWCLQTIVYQITKLLSGGKSVSVQSHLWQMNSLLLTIIISSNADALIIIICTKHHQHGCHHHHRCHRVWVWSGHGLGSRSRCQNWRQWPMLVGTCPLYPHLNIPPKAPISSPSMLP